MTIARMEMFSYVCVMSTNQTSSTLDRFILLDEMREIMRGYSEQQIFRLEREGIIPRRRIIGKRRTGWLESEVREWMQNRPMVR